MDTRHPREIAKSLRANVEIERKAQASQLVDLVELSLRYEVPEDEPHLLEYDDIPGIGRVQVGGEGCPTVSEFLADEVAALLGLSRRHAVGRISEALNLCFRHPALWQAVQALRLEASRARHAATLCAALPVEDACHVSEGWLLEQEGLSWTAAFARLEEHIKSTEPERAAAREESFLHGRVVTVSRPRDGVALVTAQLDVLDAMYLDATVDELADILSSKPEFSELSKPELRAKAVGTLAVPGYALALQQEVLQQPLVPAPPDVPAVPEAPTEFLVEHDPHSVRGHKCGMITQPLQKLQPKVDVIVHINAEDVAGATSVARIEKAGAITTATLKLLLSDKQVSVRPVIDLPELPPESQYRPSTTMRQAVQLTWEHEAFPWSTRRSRAKTMDLDHSVAFQQAGPPGQTSLCNLTPLSRTMHRAKTAGIWIQRRPARDPRIVEWTSPLGFRYRVTPRGTYRLN